MQINPIILQSYRQQQKQQAPPYHTQPIYDTFVRSTPAFYGNAEIKENFKNKLKDIGQADLYEELLDYATIYEPTNPDSSKVNIKYCEPALDLMVDLLKKDFDTNMISGLLYKLQYRDEYGYANFDELAVKNCLSEYQLVDNNSDTIIKFNRLAERLDISRDENNRFIPETFNKFNEVLKKSKNWSSTAAYMEFITDNKTHHIKKKLADECDAIAKQGVPYHLVKPVYEICTGNDENLFKKNCKKVAKFIKDNNVGFTDEIKKLNICKEIDNEITDKAYSLYDKIYKTFDDSRIISSVADYCISDGRVYEEMFNSIMNLAASCKQHETQNKDYKELDENLLFCECLKRTAGELTPNIINGFLEYIDKNGIDSNYYSDIFSLGITKNNNFDVEAVEKIFRLRDAAIERRDILKNGDEDLTDEDINNFFYTNAPDVIATVDLMGENNYIYSFSNKMDYLQSMTEKFGELKGLPKNLFNRLQEKTNLQKSKYYNEETDILRGLKNNLEKIKSPQYKEFEKQTITKIKNLSNEISKIKQTTKDTAEIKKLYTEMKQLQFNLKQQKTPEILKLEAAIKNVNDEIRNLTDISVKDPQEVIRLLNIVYAFMSDKETVSEVIKMFPTETQEEKEELNNYLSKEIFKLADVEYDEKTAEKLGLAKSRYLAEIFSTGEEFLEYFKEMINIIKENPDKSLKDIFNELPQNIETRNQFEALGINYDKWVDVDKNSYVQVQVQTDIETAKQAAIKNLEADFNDTLWKDIPKTETAKITNALKQAGFEFKKVKEVNYVGDGYEEGIKEVLRLFKENQRVEYKDLEKVIKTIKKVINENDFWTKTNKNTHTDNARSTLHNHLTKLRENEIKNIANLKYDKVSTLEVHKTDMNNIAHSLFLGNQSHCCTAVGGGINEQSAPTYVMNKLVSAIEVMDGKEFVGNTMSYIVKINNKPALFLDNIELAPKYHFNDKIRDAIFKYAEKMCAEIGKPDMPIYAGPNRHKVNMPEHTLKECDIEIVGSTGDDAIYFDFDTDDHVIGESDFMDELSAYISPEIFTDRENLFTTNTFKIR